MEKEIYPRPERGCEEKGNAFRRLCGRPPRDARRKLLWIGVGLVAAALLLGACVLPA